MNQEIEIVLRELLFNDVEYDFELYKDDLMRELESLDSFTLNFTLDKCLYFDISPIFIYLFLPKLKEKSIALIFEIALLYKSNLITEEDFLSYFDLIYSEKKSLSEIAKIILQKLKFVFTPKSQKKNALFAYKEFLYKFKPLPILDSCSLLTKEPSSIKIQPSSLISYNYSISLNTVKLCLNTLKNSSSRMVIFSTLNKLLFLYNSEIKVKEMVTSLDYNSLTLSDFYSLLNELMSELDDSVKKLPMLC